MNRRRLVIAVAEKTGLTKTVTEQVLVEAMAQIKATVASGEPVQLMELGTFKVKHCSARTGRNPQTGAPLDIAEKWVPSFIPCGPFKDMVDAAHK